MKKIKKFLAPVLLASLVLGACSSDATEESNKLVVGASSTPHAIILEHVKPQLEEAGIELEIETFEDYVLPNTALDSGDLDANFFQHLPYLEGFNEERDMDLVNAGGIHIEPIGIYSKKYDDLSDLPNGATVLLSNSVADHGRVLALLEAQGLITLDADVEKSDATFEDIKENPKKLKFKYDVDASMLPQMYNNEEGDIVVINTNYAIGAGLNPLKDALAVENEESPYVNIIATRNGDEDREDIKKLVEVLQSEETQQFILDEFDGAVIPTPTVAE